PLFRSRAKLAQVRTRSLSRRDDRREESRDTARFECGVTQIHIVQRRPGSRQRRGAPLRTNAWTPASAGATKVGLTSLRTTTRFECRETQIHCRPGVVRDTGKERGAPLRTNAATPASAGATTVGPTSARTTPRFGCGVTQIHVVPAQAGIQAKKGCAAAHECLDSGLRRSDEGGSHI